MMKLSSDTLSILKNFASINSGIEFKVGNTIRTISVGKNILAEAKLKDSFPDDFCVYDLNQFLSVHSLYKDAEVDFDESNIIFKSGRGKIKYRKTAKEMIVTAPDKNLTLPSVDVGFTLSEEDFSTILKSASVLQSTHIAVESEGSKIFLTCYCAKDDSAGTNSIEVGDNVGGAKFKMVFLTENWKMIPGSYDVELCAKGLASFKHNVQEVDYWIALEAKDSFYSEV
jgi:hypothetical protein